MQRKLETSIKNIFSRLGFRIAWKTTMDRHAFPNALEMQGRLLAALSDRPVILDVGAHEGRIRSFQKP